MKNLFKTVLTALLLVILLSGCTDNQKARSFGGTETITLPVGQKLITVTWKKADIWYLTRPRRANEPIETYKFHEKSQMGMMEGTIILKEQ